MGNLGCTKITICQDGAKDHHCTSRILMANRERMARSTRGKASVDEENKATMRGFFDGEGHVYFCACAVLQSWPPHPEICLLDSLPLLSECPVGAWGLATIQDINQPISFQNLCTQWNEMHLEQLSLVSLGVIVLLDIKEQQAWFFLLLSWTNEWNEQIRTCCQGNASDWLAYSSPGFYSGCLSLICEAESVPGFGGRGGGVQRFGWRDEQRQLTGAVKEPSWASVTLRGESRNQNPPHSNFRVCSRQTASAASPQESEDAGSQDGRLRWERWRTPSKGEVRPAVRVLPGAPRDCVSQLADGSERWRVSCSHVYPLTLKHSSPQPFNMPKRSLMALNGQSCHSNTRLQSAIVWLLSRKIIMQYPLHTYHLLSFKLNLNPIIIVQ